MWSLWFHLWDDYWSWTWFHSHSLDVGWLWKRLLIFGWASPYMKLLTALIWMNFELTGFLPFYSALWSWFMNKWLFIRCGLILYAPKRNQIACLDADGLTAERMNTANGCERLRRWNVFVLDKSMSHNWSTFNSQATLLSPSFNSIPN